MLGKVKLYFGIEGLKIDVEVSDSFSIYEKVIEGVVKLHSKSAQEINSLRITLLESYQRGRGKDQRTNDYEWGKITLNENISIPANGQKILDFRLPINPQLSKIDELGAKSTILKKFTNLLKLTKNAKSEFNIIVKADVAGTALNPEIKKRINLR